MTVYRRKMRKMLLVAVDNEPSATPPPSSVGDESDDDPVGTSFEFTPPLLETPFLNGGTKLNVSAPCYTPESVEASATASTCVSSVEENGSGCHGWGHVVEWSDGLIAGDLGDRMPNAENGSDRGGLADEHLCLSDCDGGVTTARRRRHATDTCADDGSHQGGVDDARVLLKSLLGLTLDANDSSQARGPGEDTTSPNSSSALASNVMPEATVGTGEHERDPPCGDLYAKEAVQANASRGVAASCSNASTRDPRQLLKELLGLSIT